MIAYIHILAVGFLLSFCIALKFWGKKFKFKRRNKNETLTDDIEQQVTLAPSARGAFYGNRVPTFVQTQSTGHDGITKLKNLTLEIEYTAKYVQGGIYGANFFGSLHSKLLPIVKEIEMDLAAASITTSKTPYIVMAPTAAGSTSGTPNLSSLADQASDYITLTEASRRRQLQLSGKSEHMDELRLFNRFNNIVHESRKLCARPENIE